jgi:serine/threonine-protein kinase RsbW
MPEINDPHHIKSCEFDPKELSIKLQFSGRADIDSINPVAELVMEFVKNTSCAPGKEFEVELALREALANAIIHGCKGDKEKNIQLCVACDPQGGLLIVVRDEGPGFDPHKVHSPLHGENIFSDHGRGIYLINQLMDEVTFDKGGTEIRMRKK